MEGKYCENHQRDDTIYAPEECAVCRLHVLVHQSIERLEDMLEGDDAQAWKEARKFVKRVKSQWMPGESHFPGSIPDETVGLADVTAWAAMIITEAENNPVDTKALNIARAIAEADIDHDEAAGHEREQEDDPNPPHCDGHTQFEYDCLDCSDELSRVPGLSSNPPAVGWEGKIRWHGQESWHPCTILSEKQLAWEVLPGTWGIHDYRVFPCDFAPQLPEINSLSDVDRPGFYLLKNGDIAHVETAKIVSNCVGPASIFRGHRLIAQVMKDEKGAEWVRQHVESDGTWCPWIKLDELFSFFSTMQKGEKR